MCASRLAKSITTTWDFSDTQAPSNSSTRLSARYRGEWDREEREADAVTPGVKDDVTAQIGKSSRLHGFASSHHVGL